MAISGVAKTDGQHFTLGLLSNPIHLRVILIILF